MHDIGGVLTSAKSIGPSRKSTGSLDNKWYNPEEGALYELIKGGMAAFRESGKVNTSRNLPRWATEHEDGPMPPRAGARFPRKILARSGFEYTKGRKLIASARGIPTLRAGARPIAGGGRREYMGKRSPANSLHGCQLY